MSDAKHDDATHDAATHTSSSPEEQEATQDPRAKMIFLGKLDEDHWEAWAFTAVGLAATALVVWGVAFARLGHTSVYAYSVGISLTYFMSIPIVLWGLVKSMLNPPVLRLSRSIAFVAITCVALAANNPLLDAPVSTSELETSYTLALPLAPAPGADLYVINGGRSGDRNAYSTSMPLRFSTSFTILEDGRTHPEGKNTLEDHYCYGADVLSPVDATVSQVYDSTPDHPIDEVEVQSPFGNFIVLSLPDGHALVLSFLMKGSAAVAKGDVVKAGQPIAKCGNSGPAPSPRVRVHVQNTNPDDPQRFLLSEGVPAPYHYVDPVTNEVVPRGLPRGGSEPGDFTSGQILRNP